MATIEHLHAVATSLLSKQQKKSQHLKNDIEKKLNAVNNQTNGEIYNLWKELELLHQQNNDTDSLSRQSKPAPTITNHNHHNHNSSLSTTSNTATRQKRGRKRKYTQDIARDSVSDTDVEPPRKRTKSCNHHTDTTNNYYASKPYNLRMRSSSTNSSIATKSHHYPIRTTSNHNTSNTPHRTASDVCSNDDNEHYLYKMLRNAQKAKELTQHNINLLQECINSIDVFEDRLEGDVMELGDEMRATYPEFPFKNIPATYQQKILQEQLRLNRMLDKYPDLEQTEQDVYKLQRHYVSQYKSEEIHLDELECDSELEVLNETKINVRNNNLIDSDHEDNKWCVCEQASNGKMIECDNNLCLIQWFHWRCVRILKEPKDKWFCKACRKYPTKSNLLHPKFTKGQR
eukprot:155886_1